jgi:hypothetical protein
VPRSSPPRTRLVAAAFVLGVAMLVIALSAVSLNRLLEQRGSGAPAGAGARGLVEAGVMQLIALLPAAHVLVVALAAAYLWLGGMGLRSGRDVLDTAMNVAARSLVTVAALWLGFVLLVTIRSMVQPGG